MGRPCFCLETQLEGAEALAKIGVGSLEMGTDRGQSSMHLKKEQLFLLKPIDINQQIIDQ